MEQNVIDKIYILCLSYVIYLNFMEQNECNGRDMSKKRQNVHLYELTGLSIVKPV